MTGATGAGQGSGSPAPGIAEPRGAGDTGEPDPALTEALRRWGGDPGPENTASVCLALSRARLLVPVMARPGAGADGAQPRTAAAHGAAESGASMAVPTVRGRDGRTALLAFTGIAELARWNAGARPMPVPGPDVLAALLDSDADALVLDLAGPVTFPLERSMLSIEGPAQPRTGPVQRSPGP